ncbi:MAG: hypothetical protein ACLQPD_05500 [Desulfomonilaceae bacterium]
MSKDLKQRWQEIEEKSAPILLIRLTRNYLVWIEPPCGVRWETADDYKFGGETELGKVLCGAAAVMGIPSDHLDEEERLVFKKIVGEGVAEGFEKHFPSRSFLVTVG